MILADTSVWISHFRATDPELTALLNSTSVLIHPFVIGELALGSFAKRTTILAQLKNLPPANTAAEDEVLAFIESQPLHGLGIGYIDAHLLASVMLTPGSKLWTRDKRLGAAAAKLQIAAAF
jgi:predicted nucleic acid-binding protein